MEVVALVTAALTAFLGASWYFDAPQRRLRELRRFPRRLIGGLHEAQRARVVGEIAAIGEPLIAPVTGRRCVVYIVEVYAERREGRREQVATEQRRVPFVVDDGSGRLVVDPARAQLVLDEATGRGNETHAGLTALLARHQRIVGHAPVYYTECTLEVGGQVAVLGEASRAPDTDALPPGTYRSDIATKLRMTGALVVSNRASTLR